MLHRVARGRIDGVRHFAIAVQVKITIVARSGHGLVFQLDGYLQFALHGGRIFNGFVVSDEICFVISISIEVVVS